MKDQLRPVLLQLLRLEHTLYLVVADKTGSDVPRETLEQFTFLNGATKMVTLAGEFSMDEKAAMMIEAGYPRAEIEASLKVAKAQEELFNLTRREPKKDTETLN